MKKKKERIDNTDFFETPVEVLCYRSCLKYLNYLMIFILIITVSLFGVSLTAFFGIQQNSQEIAMTLIINAAFFGMFSALFFSIYFHQLRPTLKTKIKIFNSSILFSDTRREYSLYFEDIKSVEFISFMGIARLVLKTKDNEIFSYSIWINNIEKIVEHIHKFDDKLIGKKEYGSVLKEVILAGQSVTRFEDFFKRKKALRTLAHIAFLPVAFFSFMLWKQSDIIINSRLDYYLSAAQPIIFVVFVASFVYFFLSNFLISSFMLKDQNSKIKVDYRDIDKENSIFKKLYPWYAGSLIVLLTVIVSFDINFYGVMRVANSSVPLNLIKGENVWVDKRFNCITCIHEVKNNDIIAYRDSTTKKQSFAKVMNVKPDASRVPASVIGKRNWLRVQDYEGKNSKYISYQQIIGKKI